MATQTSSASAPIQQDTVASALNLAIQSLPQVPPQNNEDPNMENYDGVSQEEDGPVPYSLRSPEHALRYADDLYQNWSLVTVHLKEEGEILGKGMFQLLSEALYNKESLSRHPLIRKFYWGMAMAVPASVLLRRTKCLVEFLENGGGRKPIGDFVKHLRQNGEENVPNSKLLDVAQKTLSLALGFVPMPEPLYGHTFKEQMESMFPPQPQQELQHLGFTINLDDIERVDMLVKPTDEFHEHFRIDGNVVWLYQATQDNLIVCYEFMHNKVARALGIETLGLEIFASLYTLYDKDKLTKKAIELGLLDPELTPTEDNVMFQLCRAEIKGVKPKVLAHRIMKLHATIERRKAWWPALIRDIERQSATQPIVFYGAILAVISVACTIVQTITSVWGLLLTLKESA